MMMRTRLVFALLVSVGLAVLLCSCSGGGSSSRNGSNNTWDGTYQSSRGGTAVAVQENDVYVAYSGDAGRYAGSGKVSNSNSFSVVCSPVGEGMDTAQGNGDRTVTGTFSRRDNVNVLTLTSEPEGEQEAVRLAGPGVHYFARDYEGMYYADDPEVGGDFSFSVTAGGTVTGTVDGDGEDALTISGTVNLAGVADLTASGGGQTVTMVGILQDYEEVAVSGDGYWSGNGQSGAWDCQSVPSD